MTIIGIVIASSIVVFVLLIVVVAVFCVCRERRRAEKIRRQVVQPALPVSPPTVSDSVKPVKPLDEWEIDRGDLMLLERIGEGFFGVVLKAQVFHRQPLESQRWMVRRSRTGSDVSGDETKSIVACKMLKGNVTFLNLIKIELSHLK